MRATPPHPQRVFMQQRPLTLLRQVRASGFQLRRVLADAEFGDNSIFRATLHRLRPRPGSLRNAARALDDFANPPVDRYEDAPSGLHLDPASAGDRRSDQGQDDRH